MYKPTIGIEVHMELKSQNKVFSYAKNSYDNSPNIYVDPRDLALPGTLPTLNFEVVEMALKAALALNCQINKIMHFDRKNYFYPDLPKGYQITQNETPIGYDGYITLSSGKKIRIQRIHIEEDTCKSIHTIDGTYLNYNRAGVPLIEIVTYPDIKTPEEAMEYLEILRETLLYLGITDAKIEEGSMRCDTNISISKDENLGVKCEVKNIGSISGVKDALYYEMKRQEELLQNNGKILPTTLRYDDKNKKTIIMRYKEVGNDYRYFPEPDIPYIHLEDEYISKVKNNLPILPSVLRKKYQELGINEKIINTLISNIDLVMFLERLNNSCNLVISANLLAGDISAYINKNNIDINTLNKEYFIKLVKYLTTNKINSKNVKDILPIYLNENIDIDLIIDRLDIKELDDSLLEEVIDKVIVNNPNSVIDYKQGLDRALKFLMGQIMKETKGSANPKIASDLLIKKLNDKIELL